MAKYLVIGADIKRELTPLERVWLACAIDGEGTIFFRDNRTDPKFKGRERGRKVGILVTNTDVAFISRAKELLGSNKISSSDRGGNRKEVFSTGIFSIEAILAILIQIIPFLIIKQKKAVFIVDHFRSRPRLKWTEEAKRKHSLRLQGHSVSTETRAKIRVAHLGHKVSDETRAKIRIAHLGCKLSEETRKLISQKARERWQAKKR